MENEESSIYNLVTVLCEKYALKQKCVLSKEFTKNLRSKAYEILLFNRINNQIVDPFYSIKCIFNKIRAWSFVLKHEYNQTELAEKIENCLNKLENNCDEDKILLENILTVLFYLRKTVVENVENDVFSLTLDEDFPWRSFNANDFSLKESETNYAIYHNNAFKLNTNDQKLFLLISHSQNKEPTVEKATNDKQQNNGTLNLNIWEGIHAFESTYERNWECCHSFEEYKQLTFISESEENYDLSLSVVQPRIIANYINQEEYIRDVKFAMVGVPSKLFNLNEYNQFSTTSLSIKAINQDVLNQYSKTFIECGNKYIILDGVINDYKNSSNLHSNYIYKEFQSSIKRYLFYYNNVVFLLSNKNALTFISHIAKQLLIHLTILTEICDYAVPKYSTKIHSIKLLNYFYKKISTSSNKQVLYLLLSILHPCFQVYYSQFLQPWLYHGVLNDPYNEFFINCIPKYLRNRDRTSWTKSFIINKSNVPDFLTSIQDKILLCGKSIHLLKMCSKNFNENNLEAPHLLCCLSHQQLQDYLLNINTYNFKILEIYGKPFSFEEHLRALTENKDKFLTMVAYKRTATLKRLELEKLKKLQKEKAKKEENFNLLREQYYEALQAKRSNIISEMAREIKETEINIKKEEYRRQVVEEEAKSLIEYYDTLMEEADSRRRISENQIMKWKKIQLFFDQKLEPINTKTLLSTEPTYEESVKEETTAEQSSVSATPKESENIISNENYVEDVLTNNNLNAEETQTQSGLSLDIMNANALETSNIALDNFAIARRNKAKVMSTEFDYLYKSPEKQKTRTVYTLNNNLTDAQRNKLKVMSTEFYINYAYGDTYKGISPQTESSKKIENVPTEKIPMENVLNNNTNDEINSCTFKKEKSLNLKLDFTHLKTFSTFDQFLKPPNFELPKMSPMSIDSTPLSDLTPVSNVRFSKRDNEASSGFTTANTICSKDCFNFEDDEVYQEENHLLLTEQIFKWPNAVELNEIKEMSQSQIQFYIEQSITVPLNIQTKLVNNELMRYFVNSLQYLKLLKSLRNYFFLMDGEFSRNFTETLFQKIYELNDPTQLLSFGMLKLILETSMYSIHKHEEAIDNLSLKINRIPKRFDLRDPNVLKCFSLTYNINWPLNVLLSDDTIEKYNEIFHFLLKLQRVSWILKRIFYNFKIFSKQLGKKSAFLSLSPHYEAIHRFRHVMTQFIQAFQNYIVGDVLHTSWELFEKSLSLATNLDSLYELHTVYIKNILFMCFLKEPSNPIQQTLQKILSVIFKFYDYLRSRLWVYEDGVYVHPNFKKLEDIFHNFEDLVLYLFKVIRKAFTSGYQKHLDQLISSWDVNNYYSQKVMISSN